MAEDPPPIRNDGPGLEAWEAWTPSEAAEQLAGVGVPWCVVGGWAIDLSLGEETREHGDLEIAISGKDFEAVRRHLKDCEFFAVGSGQVIALAKEDAPADFHQRWVMEPGVRKWRMDVMLEPGDERTWVFRRDESISAPRSDMVGTTPDGIAFLRPHGVLLYKAKAARPKDEADLAACLPSMDEPTRRWLAEGITRLHPGHRWIERLR